MTDNRPFIMGDGFSLFSVGLTRGSKLANLRASSGVTAAIKFPR